jgi:ferredoxin
MTARLRVDPIACGGVGLCVHLADALVTADSWGYPIVPDHELTRREKRVAAAAVKACPRHALYLDEND